MRASTCGVNAIGHSHHSGGSVRGSQSMLRSYESLSAKVVVLGQLGADYEVA
jgi:hypothetical protein